MPKKRRTQSGGQFLRAPDTQNRTQRRAVPSRTSSSEPPLNRADFPTDDAYLAAMIARYRRQYRLPL